MKKALQRKVGTMDEHLSSEGLFRKLMARDASCLFRAVSEQLYFSQNYHQKVRKDCVEFIRANKSSFESFVEGSFEKYLERLDDPKETVGQVEIKALSLLYRRHFIIYRYPGMSPIEIGEDDSLPKILLSCSNNGHYDIVYPKTYPANAAICQSLLYELLYTHVLGIEEEHLRMALDEFRERGGRNSRNSLSGCSEDASNDPLEDKAPREESELSGHNHSEEKAEDQRVTDGPAKPSLLQGTEGLNLPYKVLKALDPEWYRNLEFDVWYGSCLELKKTPGYMVFAGIRYFLGDKCQVRLHPKGKYYNAFVQEMGTHPSAVTVFIAELGEKHLVSSTNLKPVHPVPVWKIEPSRKSNSYSHAEQHRGELELCARCRLSRGKEMLQPSPGNLAPGRSLGAHSRSRRQMQSVNKKCQFSFVPESGEEAQDLEMVPGGPSPISPVRQPITTSEEDPEERSTTGGHGAYSEEHTFSAADAGFQHPSVYTAESSAKLTIQVVGSPAGSPQVGVATCSYSSSSPCVSSQSSPNHLQASNITPGQPPPLYTPSRAVTSMPCPAACPCCVNVAPPLPYSYDPSGNDLPRGQSSPAISHSRLISRPTGTPWCTCRTCTQSLVGSPSFSHTQVQVPLQALTTGCPSHSQNLPVCAHPQQWNHHDCGVPHCGGTRHCVFPTVQEQCQTSLHPCLWFPPPTPTLHPGPPSQSHAFTTPCIVPPPTLVSTTSPPLPTCTLCGPCTVCAPWYLPPH